MEGESSDRRRSPDRRRVPLEHLRRVLPHDKTQPRGSRATSSRQVAYLSGVYDAAKYYETDGGGASGDGGDSGGGGGGGYARAYTEEDVEELLIAAGAFRRDERIDVLLTAEWGAGFDKVVV